jgi:hypothetical protein
MATLKNLLASPIFQGLIIAFLLMAGTSAPYLINAPKEARLRNAQELCRAYGGAVLEKPYPQLAGVILISNDEVCANRNHDPRLGAAIRAALNAK